MLLRSPMGIAVLQWIVSALSILITGRILKGFEVRSFLSALIAALAIPVIMYTLGFFLLAVTFPLTVITMGLFIIVIGGIVLRVTAWILPGFRIDSWGSAFLGAVVLAIVNALLHYFIV